MARDADRELMWRQEYTLIPRVKTSLWLWIAIGILLVSNVLYIVSFVTPYWGEIYYKLGDEQQRFVYGLWWSCRYPDNVCQGIGVLDYYSGARAFAVVALFGHVLAFALMVGHVLERLLEYDPCAMGLFTAICFSTTVFMVLCVSVFAGFPKDELDSRGESSGYGYSFILACVDIPLPFIAGIMCLVETKASLMRMADKRKKKGRLIRDMI